mmetsp:Transcript_23248/g.23460  ORF Transcript_23248/g.23460 Transcript_23248/m.23460 type:complete len:437 (+) Transcript_23248:272-1582(+)
MQAAATNKSEGKGTEVSAREMARLALVAAKKKAEDEGRPFDETEFIIQLVESKRKEYERAKQRSQQSEETTPASATPPTASPSFPPAATVTPSSTIQNDETESVEETYTDNRSEKSVKIDEEDEDDDEDEEQEQQQTEEEEEEEKEVNEENSDEYKDADESQSDSQQASREGEEQEEEEEERNEIKTWIQALVSTPVSQSFSDNHSLSSSSSSSSSLSSSSSVPHNAIKQCREAFDESSLFQVSDSLSNDSSSSSLYWRQLYEKQQLREDFRTKFRNISRILDCVTCEKCRMWSKLQVMGMGTAIRILLTSNDDLKIAENMAIKEQENLKYINNEDVIEKPKSCSSESVWSPSRQEVVALLHALNQLAKSIVFASTSNINLDNKMNEIYNQVMKEKDEKEKKLKQNFSDIKNVKMKDTEKDDEDNKHKTLKPITTS